jgi:hypothetical protein
VSKFDDRSDFPNCGYYHQDLRSLPSRKLNEAELELSTPFYIDFLGGK